MAKKTKEPSPAEEHVPAEEPVQEQRAVVPVLEPDSMPEPIPAPAPASNSPSFGQRLNRFLGFLVRLLSVLVILTLVSIGLYYLLPRLYQQYIVPVQENTDQLEQLSFQQLQNEQSIVELQTRLAEIESAQATQAEAIAALETRATDLETEVAAHTETLAALDQMQTTLQSQADTANAELGRQIKLLKSMELLSRARLFMYQSNFGLAEQDVQAARDLLTSVQPDAPETLADDLTAVILRLDLTLSNLPDFPVAASDDLDIAWLILVGGLPQPTPAVNSGTPLPAATPTLVPTLTFTPASEATATPTPVP